MPRETLQLQRVSAEEEGVARPSARWRPLADREIDATFALYDRKR